MFAIIKMVICLYSESRENWIEFSWFCKNKKKTQHLGGYCNDNKGIWIKQSMLHLAGTSSQLNIVDICISSITPRIVCIYCCTIWKATTFFYCLSNVFINWGLWVNTPIHKCKRGRNQFYGCVSLFIRTSHEKQMPLILWIE